MIDSVLYRSYYAWMESFNMVPITASYCKESLLNPEHTVTTPRELWLEQQETKKSRCEAAYKAAVAACGRVFEFDPFTRCNYRRTVA